ncbi:MAG TPA: hypothetical protein VG326_01985 [Tepidisphaeraceae bacterium]|nr:hypothetical protein [Tepidisphaeraceae bacterium]
MATSIPAAELTNRIQHLLAQRQQHLDAIATIDQTLSGVGAALGGGATANGAKPAAAPAPAAAKAAPAPAATKRGRGRGRAKFALSAEESVLAFVKQHKNPTTSEIKNHYSNEGRLGAADNTLSKMVKDRKLKRTPLGKGIRGSRYTLP